MRQHTFGYLLKALRIRRGATQQQLADLSTVSVRAIRDLEFGRVSRPRPDTVRLIADALALTGRARTDFEAAAAGRPGLRDDWESVAPPAPLDGLIGRDREVTSVREALASGSHRLVTLAGLAGIGKTRVALAVAAALHEDNGFAVLWTASSPHRGGSEPRGDLSQVTEAALTEPGTAADVDELSAAIRGRTALLVLDGYTRSQIRAGAVATLLRECRDLRILMTTRVAPEIAGAWVLPLTPLPEPYPQPDVVRLRDNAAVRLLSRHVRLSRPDFEVTAANAGPVAALCRALDAIPVALAAVASWFLFYDPATVLQHVRQDPFAALEHACLAGTGPDLAGHLGILIDALDPGERALLRTLAQRDRAWTVTEIAAASGLGIAVCTRLIREFSVTGLIRPLGEARFAALELVRFALGVRACPRPSLSVPVPRTRTTRHQRVFTMESAGLLPG